MQVLKLRGKSGLKGSLEILGVLESGKGSGEEIYKHEEKKGEEGVPVSRQVLVSE